MSFGLSVRDASGATVLSISDRITRFFGTFSWTIVVGSNTTTISVPGADPSTWFAFASSSSVVTEVVADGVKLRTVGNVSGSNLTGTAAVFRA
jgi:hypothetical protein